MEDVAVLATTDLHPDTSMAAPRSLPAIRYIQEWYDGPSMISATSNGTRKGLCTEAHLLFLPDSHNTAYLEGLDFAQSIDKAPIFQSMVVTPYSESL
jgi:hypothetical protein